RGEGRGGVPRSQGADQVIVRASSHTARSPSFRDLHTREPQPNGSSPPNFLLHWIPVLSVGCPSNLARGRTMTSTVVERGWWRAPANLSLLNEAPWPTRSLVNLERSSS